MDEAQWIDQARRGSREAFSRLLRLHQANVRAFLGRFSRNPDVVDDLSQETFLTAYRKLDTYSGEAAFRTWLLGVARYQALMYLREEKHRLQHEVVPLESALDGWLIEQVESESATAPEGQERIRALRTCIGGLPKHSADLVKAHYLNGESAMEIARNSGRGESAVWMALLRIREALRHCMKLRVRDQGAPA